MFKYSIDNKSKVFSRDNIQILDLAKPIFNDKGVVTNYNTYRVSKDFCMRPDLVSMTTYNTDDQTEIILKYNGISNPLSINEEDILIIPNLDQVNNNIIDINKGASEGDKTVRNAYKYIDPSKFPTKSKENIEFENQKIGKNILPANIAPPDTSPISVRNGRVYFGENSGILCAQNGITEGEYMIAKINNENKLTK